MKVPDTIELLKVWEVTMDLPPVERALYLLACSDRGVDAGALSIGERDGRLLELREWLFGPRLLNRAACPHCGEAVEWETDLRDLRMAAGPGVPAGGDHTMDAEGYTIRFRLPNSHDLILAMAQDDPHLSEESLMHQCVLDVHHDERGPAAVADGLPETVIEALSRRMEECDPQADIRMLVHCPACGHGWEASFDIVSYLWTEIDNWASHMLQEVYVLARAFGWSEHDILTMSRRRRQLYLEMVRS